MRKFAFLFCLMSFFALTNLYGAEKETKTDITQNMRKNTSFVADTYNSTISLAQTITGSLRGSAYSAISSIFNNGVAYTLITLIICFWLFKQLKTGTIPKEELYKAMIWVITFIVVYVLLNSSGAYYEFCSWFSIPANLVKSMLSASLGMKGNVGEIMNQAFTKPVMLIFDIIPLSFTNFVETHEWYKFQYVVAPYFTWLIIAVYGLYLILLFVIVIAIIIIQIYAIFLSNIYLAFLPIMIPLLLIPQTRAIFFAWVKSYISVTMYVPLTMIPVSLMNKISSMMTSSADILLGNLLFYTLLGIIVCLVSILLLKQMPTWIAELLGVQNQGVGMGGVIGMMKTAGMGVGSAAMGWGKSMAKSASNLGSKSSKLSKLGSATNLMTGGVAGGAINTLKGLGQIAKNGFRASARFFAGKK